MRARSRTGSIAAAALCLAIAAATPASAAPPVRPGSSAVAASGPALEVRELTGPDLPLHDLAPGDTVDWAAEVTNVSGDGSPLAVRIAADRSLPLSGDAEDGVQLSVRLCEDGFEPSSSPPLCRGSVERLGSGPAATLESVVTRTPLPAGGTVGVTVRVRFPADAGDRMEDAAGMIRIGFELVDDRGADPAPGTDPGPPAGGDPGSVPPALAPAADAPGRDLLPVTGRDIASALAGALLALLGGGILLLASRRRRDDAEAVS